MDKTQYKFEELRTADVSTGNITEKDGELIGVEDENHEAAKYRKSYCEFESTFIVQHSTGGNLSHDQAASIRAAGFSEAFLDIMSHAAQQGFDYVAFDGSGGLVEGAPSFDW